MAADILAILLKTNLAAAAAILLALALRKPVRKAFGARIAYALWLLVPLAVGASLFPARTIVLPYAPPLALTVETAIPSGTTGEVATMTAAAPLIDNAVLIALWLVGAVISLSLLAWSQSRFIKSLGGVVREGRFLRAKAPAAGPAVVGAIFPRIVLPADFESRYDPIEQQVVLAHETAHLASGDAAVNAIIALAQCLFWFNPLIHLAARVVRIDQELACDAAVLFAYPQMRRPYAEALLKTQLASAPLPLGCYWPAGASNPLKERIAMLKFASPSRARRLVGGGGVLALCLGAGFAAWAAQPATITMEFAPSVQAQSQGLEPPTQPALQLAATETAQRPERAGVTAPAMLTASTSVPAEMTRSSAGNTFQRIDAEPIPARLYAIRVTMPDGQPKGLISQMGALPNLADEPDAVRAARRTYAAAKAEEAARAADGRPPQPFTPELEAAFKTMADYRQEFAAKQRAQLEATSDPIRVTTPGGPTGTRTFTYWVSKTLTADAKASHLAWLDKQIASPQQAMHDQFVKVREILAQKPTTN